MSIDILSVMESTGIISSDKFEEYRGIHDTTGRPLSDILRDDGLSDRDISYRLALELNLQFLYSDEGIILDEATARSIDIDYCIANDIVPIILGSEQKILLCSPDNEPVMERLEQEFQCTEFVVASKETVTKFNATYLRPLSLSVSSGKVTGATAINEMTVIDITQDSDSVLKSFFNNLILAAIEANASDIQIIPNQTDAAVYMRRDGKRVLYTRIDKTVIPPLVRINLMAANVQAGSDRELRSCKLAVSLVKKRDLDGDYSRMSQVEIDNSLRVQVSVRINVIPTRLGQTVNYRILPNRIKTYEDLGVSEYIKSRLARFEKLSQGLILIVGPTGSGKSTTMTAIVDRLLTRDINICSAEDPVEVIIEGVNQVDISESNNVSYADALKSFMRHDPDAIVIGEIRDTEVAKIALQAADTGHLVLSTVHTMNAVSSISRLIGMGLQPYEIVEGLVGVISQRLIRRICPKCKYSTPMETDNPLRVKFDLDPNEAIQLYKGKGCPYCNNTGYYGRLVVAECLSTSTALRRAIEERKTTDDLNEIVKQGGFRTMLDDGIEKAKKGETTFDELSALLEDSLLWDGV